jgi:hypothetical protein
MRSILVQLPLDVVVHGLSQYSLDDAEVIALVTPDHPVMHTVFKVVREVVKREQDEITAFFYALLPFEMLRVLFHLAEVVHLPCRVKIDLLTLHRNGFDEVHRFLRIVAKS